MSNKYRTTKASIAICPFFVWQSENIEGEGHHNENDVSLVFCTHKQNKNKFEGNCNKEDCPLKG